MIVYRLAVLFSQHACTKHLKLNETLSTCSWEREADYIATALPELLLFVSLVAYPLLGFSAFWHAGHICIDCAVYSAEFWTSTLTHVHAVLLRTLTSFTHTQTRRTYIRTNTYTLSIHTDGYDARSNAWISEEAPAPEGTYLAKDKAMKIKCQEWDDLVGDHIGKSCGEKMYEKLVEDINAESMVFMTEPIVAKQLQALRENGECVLCI
jgi:hypothetical protein